MQTRDAPEGEPYRIVRTDQTNILIRSLQQKKRRPGGGQQKEVASAAAGSVDKGKGKRTFDWKGEACEGLGVKRPLLLASSSAAHSHEASMSAGRRGGKAEATEHRPHVAAATDDFEAGADVQDDRGALRQMLSPLSNTGSRRGKSRGETAAAGSRD